MKKSILYVMMLTLSLVLASCIKPDIDNTFTLRKDGFYQTEFSSMDTVIRFAIHQDDKVVDKRVDMAKEIKESFELYHNLTDNFANDANINNIFYINNNPNKKIEIQKELYDLLNISEQIRIDTNGYFDISIGKIIDEWKSLLNIYKPSKDDLKEVEEKVNNIPVIKDGILLEEDSSKYYVTIKQGVKIDLGAIAKGHAVDKAKDIARSYKATYFEIRGSDSSVYYGKTVKPGRSYYTVGLSGPLDYKNPNTAYGSFYEAIKAEDISVTTSGDAIQSNKIDDFLVHHIISPVSKRPENLRRMMTIVNDSATISDALTTALFSMPEDVFEDWIKNNNNYSVIFLNKDETVRRYNAENILYPLS